MYLLIRNTLWIPLAFLGVFLLTVCLRPLLPIDETRYLTVAWEMFLRHDWLAPLTMNGEPYHHKPPLLFWLINSVWLITGSSRWSATIPPILAGIISTYLTIQLAARLFRNNLEISQRVPFIMIGSLLFLFYSSMIMFDVTLTVFVLAALHGLLSFSRVEKMALCCLDSPVAGLRRADQGSRCLSLRHISHAVGPPMESGQRQTSYVVFRMPDGYSIICHPRSVLADTGSPAIR